MVNNILLNLFFFLLTLGVYAQIPDTLLQITSEDTQYNGYLGSVYRSSKPQNATIIDEGTGTYNAKLRYNINLDQMEYRPDKKEALTIVLKNPRIHIRFDKELFYYCRFKTGRSFRAFGYYVLVDLNENYKIYKKYHLEVSEPGKYDSTQAAPQRGNITQKATYYLEENGFIIELPAVKDELLNVFKDKKEGLQKFIKSEKIKPRKEDDLIPLIAHYNILKSNDSGQSRSLLSNSSVRK